MSHRNDEFVATFKALPGEVNRRAGKPDSRTFELDEACARDRSLDQQRVLLRYIRDIRNMLQHPRHHGPGPAFEVSESLFSEANKLLRRLMNPPTAMKLGVARVGMRVAARDERLGDLAADMKREGSSHISILDERHAVIGVFNEAAVFSHLWADTETIIGQHMKLAEILDHCRLDAGHTERFHFVDPRTPIDLLIEEFIAIETPTTRVGEMFITASGKPTEPLQRMITPRDVLAVERLS